ncbi:hypothetical protein PFICI_14571 [Pestalotiopsis fici W106-1]|uniref:Uncharacterized protein n=1 Tax=Pestalotiopsis fici (strain W106-1 / CGMCC3.15140) TaxID=1229662 RepID=W3WI67_PESFW|nr:uncharacterized protein PFICI_14571 [Pestalotiopsis fici W106-1]ETS73625.1 hypothetical protein PFICI_14571 [Pestalotiopsis fici W106-1]
MSTVSASKPITMTDRGPTGPSSYLQQEPQPPGMIGPTPSFPGPPSPSDFRPMRPSGGGGFPTTALPFPQPPQQQQPSLPPTQPVSMAHTAEGLKYIRTAAESSLRDYVSLQRRRRYDDPVAEDRLRIQRGVALADLRTLRSGVSALVKASESHRWGRWVLGGFFATLIPAVRRLFRRPSDDQESSNDTEYAFRKSKGLISRTWTLVRNNGALASMGLLVLSVLYVFQAEVSLRVARTVSKRLKRLIQRIEIGDEVLDEKDLNLFTGWRWRVLSWKS